MTDEALRQRYPELAELVDGPEFVAITLAYQAQDRELTRLRAESADLRAAVGRDIAIIGQLRQQLGAAQATRDETHVWTNTDWKERAEQAAAALADLNWLIAAGVDIIIGAVDHNGGADLCVALDLEDEPDDNPAWYGPLGESLADARAHCEALEIGP